MAPVRRRAAAKEPADKKPVVKKLADKKPVVKKLADKKPVVKKLAVKKPVVKKPAEKKPRPRNVAKIRIDDTIARCPGGTPAYQHRKEFLLIRPSCTEAEVKMARGADYKPLRTYKNLPAGKKKAVRLTREEYCVIRDWRIRNGVAPFRKPKFDTKWGWNHEDAWDVYYMTHTHEDPSYR